MFSRQRNVARNSRVLYDPFDEHETNISFHVNRWLYWLFTTVCGALFLAGSWVVVAQFADGVGSRAPAIVLGTICWISAAWIAHMAVATLSVKVDSAALRCQELISLEGFYRTKEIQWPNVTTVVDRGTSVVVGDGEKTIEVGLFFFPDPEELRRFLVSRLDSDSTQSSPE